MKAEQQTRNHFQLFETLRHVELPPVRYGKDFEIYAIFSKFWNDVEQFGLDQAKHRRKTLLKAQLRSFAQENNKVPNIFPTATQITRANRLPELEEDKRRIVFRHAYHADVVHGNQEELKAVSDNEIHQRFHKEQQTYYRVWGNLIQSIVHLIGDEQSNVTEKELQQNNFQKRIVKRKDYWKALRTNESPKDASIFDPLTGICALFPELAQEDEIEVFESTQWRSFVSTQFRAHAEGKTTIARLEKLVYIPRLNEFFAVDEGLYTGYSNDQIVQILKFDENQRMIPEADDQILSFIAILSTEFANTSAFSVFEEMKKRIGYFTDAPIGEGVQIRKTRNFTNYITYIEQLIDFEYRRCIEHPEWLETLQDRLSHPDDLVAHSLLRGNDDILPVQKLLTEYKKGFAKEDAIKSPAQTTKEMVIRTTSIYGDWINRAQSLSDCTIGTFVGGAQNAVGQSITQVFGKEFVGKTFSNAFLQQGIEQRRLHDFASEAEARAFAKMYNIPVDWFDKGYVHSNSNESCSTCGRVRKYIGHCGKQIMCLQCNAQYNLDHGLVGGKATSNSDSEITRPDGEGTRRNDPSYNGLMSMSDIFQLPFNHGVYNKYLIPSYESLETG